jgi:arsenate reductase
LEVVVTIWHNPDCSTSRSALVSAERLGITPTVRRYLRDAPSEAELRSVLAILEDPPADLVRKDAHFASLGLDADDYRTKAAVARLLAAHPRLIQRPVLIEGDRAIIGRPKDRVEPFLSASGP